MHQYKWIYINLYIYIGVRKHQRGRPDHHGQHQQEHGRPPCVQGWVLGFRVQGAGCRVQGSECMV